MIRALAVVLATTPAAAQDLASAVTRLEAALAADPIIASCPADIYRSRQVLLDRFLPKTDVGPEDCRSDPTACVTACLDTASGEACLAMAIMLEVDDTPHLLPARHAHALACALGEAGGCTNRAAGIRNRPLPGDALSLQPFHEKAPCLLESFTLACKGEDSWGCAMLGQAYHLGDGTPPDSVLARRHYQAACDLAAPDMDFPACTFAREALATLP
ncbi:MAG: SEL1-like repeat protein [Tabrizicola sp.]|jgi:TPR repeat protein|nr:SEL1-like repeat protein [Tabrizicola sp.]